VYQIPVYKAELDAGLGEAIRTTGSLAYACETRPWDAEHHNALARLRSLFPESARAALSDIDLYFLQTILVSTGWNRNDDVFDPMEVWVARHTPEHKPFNYEHDCANIIGHIISNWVIDSDGNLVAETSAADELPAKFHVATGAVLYKYWEKPELQERMDRILVEIAKGEWFVSMECLFKGFDYALQARDGSMRVVARNEKTAFLTKHLRVYGGSGRYGEYKVGRLLRNIIFSGKGLVRKPANPDSVILPDTEPFSASKAILISDFSQVSAEQVYSPVAKKEQNERNHQMANELEAMQKQLETLKFENEALKARAEAAEAAKAKADELLKAAQEALAKAQAEAEQVKAKLIETETALNETREELKRLYAEQVKVARIAIVKDKLKLSDEDAAEFVATNEGLPNEVFNKQVEILAKTITKQTSSSATSSKVSEEEQDDDGEQAAAFADFRNVESDKNIATLSTAESDSGVNDVLKAIADYLGYEEQSEEDNPELPR